MGRTMLHSRGLKREVVLMSLWKAGQSSSFLEGDVPTISVPRPTRTAVNIFDMGDIKNGALKSQTRPMADV